MFPELLTLRQVQSSEDSLKNSCYKGAEHTEKIYVFVSSVFSAPLWQSFAFKLKPIEPTDFN